MANTKTGLNYYTIDCDRYQDRKIKRLKKDLGCKGIAVYDYILCEIYRVRGCFLEWDDNTVFDVAEYFGLEENTVREVVRYCGSVGLFDRELLSRGIITSLSIQHRYIEMCTRAKRKAVVIPDVCAIKEYGDDDIPEEVSAHTRVCHNQNEEIGDIQKPFEPYSLTLDQEIEMLKKEDAWFDQLQVLHSMDTAKLRSCLDDFKVQCLADGKDRHQSLSVAKAHFNSWLRIVNNKNRKKDDNNRPNSRNQRRANLLKADEPKTYGDSF